VKRHRHYIASLPTATSIPEFQRLIAKIPQAEIAMFLLVRATWFDRSTILGLAQCRRTYYHLLLEFLSVHPAIVGRLNPQISGIGKGLLYGLAEIATCLKIEVIWGEATAFSAPFYSHVLGIPQVEDHFFIRGETLARCRRGFREIFFGGT
jgi:hypothetical protein